MAKLYGRRLIATAGLALAVPGLGRAASPLLRLATGPLGGGAERYGAALCATLGEAGPVRLAPRHTLGSSENLYLLDSGHVQFACASLELVAQAVAGQGGFAPRRLRRLRALAPIFGAPLRLYAPAAATLGSWRGLAGKRVGCAPAAGAALGVLNAMAEALGITTEAVEGEPAEIGAALARGRLDALLLAPGQDAAGFGSGLEALPLLPMTAAEQASLAAALPGLGPAELVPGLPGLAAWTLLLAQAGLAAAWAEPVAELALSWPAALRQALPPGTLPGTDWQANAVLPWHPGAYPAWQRAGFVLPEPPA